MEKKKVSTKQQSPRPNRKAYIYTSLTLTAVIALVVLLVFFHPVQKAAQQVPVAAASSSAPAAEKPIYLDNGIGSQEGINAMIFQHEKSFPMLKKDKLNAPPQSTKTVFVERLSDTQMSQPFHIPEGYGFVKIWVKNAGKQRMAISLSKDSPTGELIPDSIISIQGGSIWSIYKTTPWDSGNYYINFTSEGAPLKGVAVGRVGARLAELNP